MKSRPNVDQWQHLGSSTNAEFYEIEAGILAVVPAEGTTDNAETATESVEFQHQHWSAKGRSGGSIIYMDQVGHSEQGAREVYGQLPDPRLITGFALVGGTILGRAIGSVFIGLSRPSAPTKLFGSDTEALAWLRQLNERAA
ncbi:MAG: hypothetical protein AAGA56_25280 [Myxococcota bacterium]